MAEKAPKSGGNVAHVAHRSARENRTIARERCRGILAAHINERTGLSIQPRQVRLFKTEKDGYCWVFHSDDIRQLFLRGLSSLGVGVHMRLSREVGQSFEAVACEPTKDPGLAPNLIQFSLHGDGQGGGVEPLNPHGHLVDQNVTAEEADSRRLRIELENANAQYESCLQQLQECTSQLQGAVQKKEYYESVLLKVFLSMNDVGGILEGLREESCKALCGHSEMAQAANIARSEAR